MCRWEDNIKMNLQESGWRLGLNQNRPMWRALVKAEKNIRVPKIATNFLLF
jgi:hypothetical protein